MTESCLHAVLSLETLKQGCFGHVSCKCGAALAERMQVPQRCGRLASSHATAVKSKILHTKGSHCYTAAQSINCIAHCSSATVGACTDHAMASAQPIFPIHMQATTAAAADGLLLMGLAASAACADADAGAFVLVCSNCIPCWWGEQATLHADMSLQGCGVLA